MLYGLWEETLLCYFTGRDSYADCRGIEHGHCYYEAICTPLILPFVLPLCGWRVQRPAESLGRFMLLKCAPVEESEMSIWYTGRQKERVHPTSVPSKSHLVASAATQNRSGDYIFIC